MIQINVILFNNKLFSKNKICQNKIAMGIVIFNYQLCKNINRLNQIIKSVQILFKIKKI